MSVVFPTSELNPLTAITTGRLIDVSFPALIVPATNLADAHGIDVGAAIVLLRKNCENYIAEPPAKQSSYLILKTISYESRPPF